MVSTMSSPSSVEAGLRLERLVAVRVFALRANRVGDAEFDAFPKALAQSCPSFEFGLSTATINWWCARQIMSSPWLRWFCQPGD